MYTRTKENLIERITKEDEQLRKLYTETDVQRFFERNPSLPEIPHKEKVPYQQERQKLAPNYDSMVNLQYKGVLVR